MAEETKENEGRSPLFGSWRNFYIAVMLWLLLLIALFYAFTIYFR